jgi:hypothetical protein
VGRCATVHSARRPTAKEANEHQKELGGVVPSAPGVCRPAASRRRVHNTWPHQNQKFRTHIEKREPLFIEKIVFPVKVAGLSRPLLLESGCSWQSPLIARGSNFSPTQPGASTSVRLLHARASAAPGARKLKLSRTQVHLGALLSAHFEHLIATFHRPFWRDSRSLASPRVHVGICKLEQG